MSLSKINKLHWQSHGSLYNLTCTNTQQGAGDTITTGYSPALKIFVK